MHKEVRINTVKERFKSAWTEDKLTIILLGASFLAFLGCVFG